MNILGFNELMISDRFRNSSVGEMNSSIQKTVWDYATSKLYFPVSVQINYLGKLNSMTADDWSTKI